MSALTTAPAVVAGTTLDVLQAYPLGTLQVEYTNWHDARGLVIGLAEGWALIDFGNERGRVELEIDQYMMPILRPLLRLCDSLPDGTVPALAALLNELLPIGFPWRVFRPEYHSRLLGQPHEFISFMAGAGTMSLKGAHLDQSGILTVDTVSYQVLPWLCRHHFALPVNGRPLVEGVDFIPK